MTLEPAAPRYRELAPPPELGEHLRCGWVIEPDASHSEAILPDGCIDIVWRAGEGAIVAGPDTGPVPVVRRAGSKAVGVRFRPGAAPAMLGVPADELRDLRVPLAELWGDAAGRLEDELDGAGSASARLELIERALRRRLDGAERPDGLVAAAVARLRGPEPPQVRELADALAVSERQMRRRFHAAVGYGPKVLARILRFQRMLALARQPASREDLARLALDAGYADQAHMTAECTRLAGAPPARLIAERYPAAARG
jgi:AraC-like DNA-binding protein